ncbi:hypothetical protein BDV98DRAFT_583064 [Pterulicium gracile]|uniref:Uncharacterized protein n=1 Tax=Pterulicium gracile TaxID=1884261 RepID=A0A5C3QHP4_9AGAR|nr:hypothetical protein BDV98DRAFT_583064 [Pterula gracilis]
MPYKRPITDLNFNMALLLPAPTPAVVGSSYFSVVGVPLDVGLLAGPEADLEADDEGGGMTRSTRCWNLVAMTQEEVETDDEGGGMVRSARCWDLCALAQEEVKDEWSIDVDQW